MRVWRRVELDRVEPGRWLLVWERRGTRSGVTEDVKIEGPPRTLLRFAWRVVRRTNRWVR